MKEKLHRHSAKTHIFANCNSLCEYAHCILSRPCSPFIWLCSFSTFTGILSNIFPFVNTKFWFIHLLLCDIACDEQKQTRIIEFLPRDYLILVLPIPPLSGEFKNLTSLNSIGLIYSRITLLLGYVFCFLPPLPCVHRTSAHRSCSRGHGIWLSILRRWSAWLTPFV